MNSINKVSIIVPVYNIELYISSCIESLLNQTYKNLEIILVDDGSSDESSRICDDYKVKDSRIIVIHKINAGASLARKDGLDMATGDYILFVDGDDWIDETTISECLNAIVRDNADCVIFGYIKEFENMSIYNYLFDQDFSFDLIESEKVIHSHIVGPDGVGLRAPHRVDNLSTCWGRLMKIDIAKRGRFVSEKVVGTSEDTIFNLYALEKCKISYINKCYYHYRKDNSNSITTKYKSDLAEKWDVLYQIMREYVSDSEYSNKYEKLLQNRIACSIIGLGFNELNNPGTECDKVRNLRAILSRSIYRKAIEQLDISGCDIKWRIFFILCKVRATVLLLLLLRIMDYLRSRIAA